MKFQLHPNSYYRPRYEAGISELRQYIFRGINNKGGLTTEIINQKRRNHGNFNRKKLVSSIIEISVQFSLAIEIEVVYEIMKIWFKHIYISKNNDIP